MVVVCGNCGKRYDDADRWTICPHRPLDEAPAPSEIALEARRRVEKDIQDMSRAIQEQFQTPHQLRIEEFMRRAGQELPGSPVIPSEEVRILRARLILEEAFETISAGLGVDIWIANGEGKLPVPWSHGIKEVTLYVNTHRPPDLKEIADGCADISVVTIGTLSACGIKDKPLLEEVDRSNLAKFELPRCQIHGGRMVYIGNGKYECESCGEQNQQRGPYRAPDGKWIKGPAWTPPDIERVLREQSPPEPPKEKIYNIRGREMTALEALTDLYDSAEALRAAGIVSSWSIDDTMNRSFSSPPPAPQERLRRASDDGVRAVPSPEIGGKGEEITANGIKGNSVGMVLPFPRSPTGFVKILAYDPFPNPMSPHSKPWSYLLCEHNPTRPEWEGHTIKAGLELEELILKQIQKVTESAKTE